MNKQALRTRTENILIILLTVISLITLIVGFFPTARWSGFFLHALEMKRMSARAFSLVLLITTWNLYERKRMAWTISLVMIFGSFIRHLMPPVSLLFLGVAVFDAVALVLLFLFRADFQCPSEPRSVKRGVLFLLLTAAGIVLNAGIGYHFIRLNLSRSPKRIDLWESMVQAVGILFGTTNNNAHGFPSVRFENFLFWFSWGCMLLAVLFFFQPWIERFLWTESDMQRARRLVLKYGQNPASYLTLEKDKLLYFGTSVEGVLPYGIVQSTVVVNGDPVCAAEDFPALLKEFTEFCRRSRHGLVFLSVTDRFLDVYRAQGFGLVKCGEEARFDLSVYEISGKKGAKMRMNVNHAERAGIRVSEYRPREKRNAEIEEAMNRITEEWLSDKKSGLLTFTMGTADLKRPMDRRYFYATDADGKICAYNVYCPFGGKTGYMADITRRSHDAPSGVTEKIMIEAFRVFRDEGVRYASLGIAPLANVIEDEKHPGSAAKFLNFIYEHLNACYGFKNLYRAKENYSPTEWLPGYYAWYPKLPSPEMLYAVVRIQNPKGVGDFAKALLPKMGGKK